MPAIKSFTFVAAEYFSQTHDLLKFLAKHQFDELIVRNVEMDSNELNFYTSLINSSPMLRSFSEANIEFTGKRKWGFACAKYQLYKQIGKHTFSRIFTTLLAWSSISIYHCISIERFSSHSLNKKRSTVIKEW